MKNTDHQSASSALSSSTLPTSPSSEERLDQLLLLSPLEEPSNWFTAQTMARIRREHIDCERRTLRWIWSGICAMTLILILVGIEIREQSQNEIISLVSIENSESSENEGLWLGQ